MLCEMARAEAPIDGFGIGTSLTTSSDGPALDCAYKLQEYAGLPRRKRSAGKATWPGRKQVWRRYDAHNRMEGDVLSLESDAQPGEALIQCVMQGGQRLGPRLTLDDIREHAAQDLRRLPISMQRLETTPTYPVVVADALRDLAAAFDRHQADADGTGR